MCDMEDEKKTCQLEAEAAKMDSETDATLSYFDSQIEYEYFQTLESSPDLAHGLPGLLRYKRESQEKMYNSQAQYQKDSPICCQFCGLKAWPPLDMVYLEMKEGFCCEKYKELFDIVVSEKQLALKHFEESVSGRASLDDVLTNEEDGLHVRAREMVKHRLSIWQQKREMERSNGDSYSKLSAAKNDTTPGPDAKTVISFQLSNCAPKENTWSIGDCMYKVRSFDQWLHNEPSTLDSFGFGLTHHQNISSFLEKNYSNGTKFLTVLPDGSSQIFYPSGNLAIIIIKSKEESICIIHDDTVSPVCPIRGLFQSDGRATCYHGNGSIWLNMDAWGGKCLDEGGRKIRTWSWTNHGEMPTVLKPIFMSLNINIGVRVLGQKLVFVSFLALGQQARFRVGSCFTSTKNTESPYPLKCKEELLLLACRIALHMAITRLQQCHKFPASSTHLKIRPPTFLHPLVQRLQRLSQNVQMEETDRTFIKHCLQSCASDHEDFVDNTIIC